MTVCTDYCNTVAQALQDLSSEMDIVIAHESTVKDVPVRKTIAAIGIKKCVIADMPSATVDDSVKVETKERKILVTVGINLYVPYSKGTKGCTGAFDNIFSTLVKAREGELNEAKLLSTKYSRETQCLVSETEFVFEAFFTGIIQSPPPIVMG